MKDEKGQNDLEFIIEQHKRDIWAYKMKESEWMRTENQLQGTKKIVEELSTKVVSLKKLNGELSRDNKYLAKQIEDYREILKKAGL
jgi:GTP-sensing pleiotropic transcriptional regulator CodY